MTRKAKQAIQQAERAWEAFWSDQSDPTKRAKLEKAQKKLFVIMAVEGGNVPVNDARRIADIIYAGGGSSILLKTVMELGDAAIN